MITHSLQKSYALYSWLRAVKPVLILIYSLLAFFEKPFYCYSNTTLPILRHTKCNDNIPTMNLPIIPNLIFRIIEIFLLSSFFIIQYIFIKQRKILHQYTPRYKVIQLALQIIIIVCIVDIVISLLLNIFPIFNFILRGFIIILLVRILRNSWFRILYLLYKTRTMFILLLAIIIIFGLIANLFFKDDKDFSNLGNAMYSLYILLSTCNFPDVLLGTLNISKLSIFYFAIYIAINFYVILALLKALYYYNYIEFYKEQVSILTKNTKEFLFNPKFATNENKFYNFLIELNKKYYIDKNEYNKILSLVNLNKVREFYYMKRVYNKQEILLKSNKILKIYNKKYVEFLINCINIIFIFLRKKNNQFLLIIQLLWSILFIIECLIHIHYLGFKRVIINEFFRFVYYIDNYLVFIILITLELFKSINKTIYFDILFDYYSLFIIIRAIRIFVFIGLFQEFKIIYHTLQNMKKVFYDHCICLFSFFFIFSTFSMILTGGNIHIDSFIYVDSIPNNYYHINFNDFGSSFLSCFALTMINNLNILARSLSFNMNKYQKLLNFYFATFYFMSTLIILNIIETLLLEMYLSIKRNKSK